MRRHIWLIGSALVPAAPAMAQTASDVAAEEIVVTGTRAEGRDALASWAPIDVVSERELEETGYIDLNRALNFLEPSINFPRAATTASAANTRPITLRGLSPDQTLVLVNGKRRHTNAVLNVNNTVGRGSAGVDLDTIPQSAIARIEVLRDGAAAQYGSDAIGGVVNIILKSNASGGSAAIQGGITEEGDGLNGLVSASMGLPLGDGGHLTISALGSAQEAVNRANIDQRFGRVTYRIGDPEAKQASGSIDFAMPLGAAEIYGFGTLTRKVSNNGAGFRVPGTAPSQPDGFLPIIEPRIWDYGATIGVRGTVGSINADLSQTFGYNKADFRVFDTANASLGVDSPSRFDSGGVTYKQAVTDFGLSRPLDDLLFGGNVAIGAQYRHENYSIREGEPAATFGVGADGFAGFAPRIPVDQGRDAYAVYADLELQPIPELFLGGAVRYDDYDDFGGKTTWRGTARIDLIDGFALRGTIGTGFKAPSLQQQYFSAVQGALSAGNLVSVATLPVDDTIAAALGAVALKPETSRNYTAGIVLTPTKNLNVSVDWFKIRIKDRIVLTEQLRGGAVDAILSAAGVTGFSQVRFFSNAVDTTTEGVEITVNWSAKLATDTRLSVNAGFAMFDTDLDELRANPVLPSFPLLGVKSILFLTKAQPKDKFTLQARLDKGPFEVLGAVTAFGSYTSQPIVAVQEFDGGTSVDLAVAYGFGPFKLQAGVQNLLDDFPEAIEDQVNFIGATGGSFPTGEETPLGLNGRTYFLRASATF